MIDVVYEPRLHRVTVKGHAGAAEKGKDLVCAAVSALTYTLAANVLRCTTEHHARLTEGDAEIVCAVSSSNRAEVDCIFTAICTGYKLLADNFPEFINYKSAGIEKRGNSRIS